MNEFLLHPAQKHLMRFLIQCDKERRSDAEIGIDLIFFAMSLFIDANGVNGETQVKIKKISQAAWKLAIEFYDEIIEETAFLQEIELRDDGS